MILLLNYIITYNHG